MRAEVLRRPKEALDAVAEAVDALASKMLFGYGVMSPGDILAELVEKGLDKQETGRIVITVAGEKLVIAGNGESEEVCRVIKGETYTSVTQHFDDIFITTAPVSVITEAILAMADHLNGEDVSSEIRIGVKTLDVTDIADYDGIIWP